MVGIVLSFLLLFFVWLPVSKMMGSPQWEDSSWLEVLLPLIVWASVNTILKGVVFLGEIYLKGKYDE